jgi:hypothetical protein
MMKIFIPNPAWGRVPLLRQTSQYSGIAEKATYHIRQDELDKCDYALIFDTSVLPSLAHTNKRIKKVFVHMENQSIWSPSADDLVGIDTVVSPYVANTTYSAGLEYLRWFPCVPWFYGISFATNLGLLHQPLSTRLELDEMRSMRPPKKKKILSVIISSKQGTPGHKWRKDVATAIKREFRDIVDVYGFGANPVPDKRAALDPYIYSVVIENSASSFYATEKIVDCLIAWTIPIYSGAENIDDLLDVNIPRIPYGCSPDNVVKEVRRIIRRGEWNERVLMKARIKAMDELNIFEALPKILENA